MQKTVLVFVVFFLMLLAIPVITQEVLVPLDEEGKIETIDRELEKSLQLFTEYSSFREARLFQVNDTSFVLEVFYKPGPAIHKDRIFLSNTDVTELRSNITKKLKERIPQVMLNQEGRTELLVGTLGLSLGFYGWAAPIAFGVEDPKVSVALNMFTSGASFFAPFMLTRNISVTNGQATLAMYGGSRGIAHGICLGLAVFGEDSTFRKPIGSGVVISIAEAVAGFQLAGKTKMEAGKAEVIGVGGDFGMGLGFGTGYLADFLEDDDVQFRSIGGSVLLGSGIGLLAGNWLSNRQYFTQGDANVLRAAGFLGAYMPLAIVDMVDSDNAKSYVSASMAGSVLGLGAGHMLVKGKDFTTGQGRLITFGEFAGGLVGLGCAYLFSSENADNSTLFLSSSAAGAAAGFFFMYRSFAGNAREREGNSSLNINIAPEGLLALALKKESHAHPKVHTPLIRIDLRF